MDNERPLHLQALDEAGRFWQRWQDDPDADVALANPWDAILGLLTDHYDQHPLQARWTARVALEGVIAARNQSENGGMN